MKSIYKSAEGERAVGERYLTILKHWPVPNEQLRVPTREGGTFVVACGAENAPPLLLLHGAMANSAMWMGEVAAWAARFRVYAVDLIGEAGLSAPSRPFPGRMAGVGLRDATAGARGKPGCALSGRSRAAEELDLCLKQSRCGC